LPQRLLTPIFGALALLYAVSAESGTLKDYRQLILDGHQLKWGAPVLGEGAVITFALAAAEMEFADARNCKGIAPLAGLLAVNGVDGEAFRNEMIAAFAAWQAVADITFRETDPARADIIIGAEIDPLGRAFTNVVYDKAANGDGPRRLTQSVICLNPDVRWKVGFDGDLDRYDFRYTLLHEIGHAIGLDHPPGRRAVMDFAYQEAFRVLQPGDVEGIVGLYGPPRPGEPAAVATGAAEVATPSVVTR
jgi:hypothetical protein